MLFNVSGIEYSTTAYTNNSVAAKLQIIGCYIYFP